jgi:hypothetical protein
VSTSANARTFDTRGVRGITSRLDAGIIDKTVGRLLLPRHLDHVVGLDRIHPGDAGAFSPRARARTLRSAGETAEDSLVTRVF